MSNSATNLDLVSSGQAQKEVTINQLFDAASPAMLYGRRALTTGGLVWGYYGGALIIDGTPTAIANGTITLTASATNYVEADPATGAVSKSTSGFTSGRVPLYQVVAGASIVSSYTDLRSSISVASGGGGSQPFDVTAFYPGATAPNAIVTRVPVARAVTFPAGLAGSVATASAAATAQTDFAVRKNGAAAGTIRFAAGASSATFIAASPIVLAAGDVISIHAPGTADATLVNVGIVLAGTR